MNTLLTLTAAQLHRAADVKEKINRLENELATILGGPAPAAKPEKKRKGMTAAGRSRIAAAQKARWAKIKAAKRA